MFGSISKFAKNRKGAFAMQFALMAMPLCVCTGLAIDGGRAFLARFELASALDAAALAVGSTTTEGADLNAVAEKYVNINFKTAHDKPIKLDLVVNDKKATLKGSVDINTFFMPLVGQPTVNVSAESEVRVGGNNVEVAMALDVTGSMAGTRIKGLQDAAKVLIDEVVNTVQTPYFSKIAVVPWSQSVYVGTKHVPNTTTATLRGTPTGSTAITGVTWRGGSAGTQSISSAGWRTSYGGKTVSGVAWKNGAAQAITSIVKASSTSTFVTVTTSANHGYANGDFVRITGATGGFTSLNNNVYVVADKANKTFTLKSLLNLYVVPVGSPAASGAASSQRCYDSACNVAVTPNAALGVSVGSRVRVTGVNGFTEINNGTDQSWTVAALVPSTNAFTISELTGPNIASTFTTSSSSVASECYLSDCKFQITTASLLHGLSTGDNIFVWGATVSGSGTTMITPANSSWSVTQTSLNQITLPGSGYSYRDWSSGGSFARCLDATCNVQITSNNHGLGTGDRVELASIGGLTFLNTSSTRRYWVTTKLSSNVFRLNDTTPALDTTMANTYTNNTGTSQCLSYGCAKLNVGTSITTAPYLPTQCIVERYGASTATDVSPADSLLGMYYSSDGSCTTSSYVTPLTADRTRLNTAIDDLKTGGSTAGQIGIAWAWYMLSPNFKGVWTKEAVNEPKAYNTKELVKVAVLMTDGEFNYATCKGVSSGTTVGGTACNATDEFVQAQNICTAMKNQRIVVYTVGLSLTDQSAKDFLTACATSKSYAYLAADTDELKAAFKKIATSISKLRISK